MCPHTTICMLSYTHTPAIGERGGLAHSLTLCLRAAVTAPGAQPEQLRAAPAGLRRDSSTHSGKVSAGLDHVCTLVCMNYV